MDQASQAEFDRITQLDPSELTQQEVDFLYARRDYLRGSKLKEFAPVIKARTKAVVDAQKAEEEEKAAPVEPEAQVEVENTEA